MSEGFLDQIDDDAEMTITLELEDDTELECTVLAIFPVGEQQYVALTPATDEKEIELSEESEVFFYRFTEYENEEIELENIEDEEEYEKVTDAFDELLDEQEFEETFDGEEE